MGTVNSAIEQSSQDFSQHDDAIGISEKSSEQNNPDMQSVDSDWSLFMSVGGTSVSIYQPGDVLAKTGHYDGFASSLGVFYNLNSGAMPKVIRQTGPQFGLYGKLVFGGVETLASNLKQGGVFVGWKQFVGKNVYISPQATTAYSSNELNFGRGYLPPQEHSFNVGAQIFTGVEFPASSPTRIGLDVGYTFESPISGEPDYVSHGFAARLNLVASL